MGELRDIHDGEWARFEYEVPDLYTFQDVARRPGHVVSLRAETDGRPDRSVRFAEFLRPSWGYTDELRAALRADGHTWGFFALFRDRHHSEFTAAEHEFTSRVATAFAIGLRTGLLATAVGTVPVSGGPAVLVIGPDDEICQTSLGAADRVAELGGGTLGESPLPLALRSLVGAARRFAAEGRAVLPKVRLRTRSGQWMIAHASPLLARDGHTADVVVTIEEARPPEIVPLVVAAFGLTPRERDVVRLVLQGVGTGEVAKTLHMSTYTVQDHLKSIFTKAGVRSRRELTAKVFYDQYAPAWPAPWA
ncbi:response regulator transcription factor [Thermocatellispora tengchongensis]|uniref:response regulator transcription factor n=1 Tax=Thermocatellispora tengchongensis TaxID=1073253 RepID=UPI0036254D7C